MIKDKTDLLDPTAESNLSEYEKQVVEEAQKVGNSPQSTGAAGSTTGFNEYGENRGRILLQLLPHKPE